MDRHAREALDRHITGNYGEDQWKGVDEDGEVVELEVDEDEVLEPTSVEHDHCRQRQRPRWEAGSLSTTALRGVLVDALSDLWQDGYRRDNPVFQRNQFREVLNDVIYEATNGQGGEVGR